VEEKNQNIGKNDFALIADTGSKKIKHRIKE